MGGIRLLTVCVLLSSILACSGGEQRVVTTFLSAVQGGDEAAVSGVSLVEFPGSVSSWEIVEVGPESLEPFTLAELRRDFLELQKKVEATTEENDAFVQENAAQYREVQRLLERDPEHSFSGDLAEFKEELDARLEEHEKLTAEFEEKRGQIIALRDAAGLSLNTAVNDNFDGEVKGKVVLLKVNDGSEEKTYNLKLQRFELSDTERNITPIARWIITGIEEGA